ncbi:MAG: hypothetical protein N2316_09225 [Spirochaetes bacterium]|nr:hypothetical protein [Spirochaetota bacterium]
MIRLPCVFFSKQKNDYGVAPDNKIFRNSKKDERQRNNRKVPRVSLSCSRFPPRSEEAVLNLCRFSFQAIEFPFP